MKALSALRVLNQSSVFAAALLVSTMSWVYPELVLASNDGSQKSTTIFEIKDPTVLKNSSALQFDDVVQNDPIVPLLEKYLEDHKSPLAPYAAQIVQQPQWKRALAVSWVESNFGRFCANNNCSGIGGAPGMSSWRVYENKLEWFKDMSKLLETPRYKEKYTTFQKMRGVYVQPGTDAWVYGATRKYNELSALEMAATEQKLAELAQPLAYAN